MLHSFALTDSLIQEGLRYLFIEFLIEHTGQFSSIRLIKTKVKFKFFLLTVH